MTILQVDSHGREKYQSLQLGSSFVICIFFSGTIVGVNSKTSYDMSKIKILANL